MQEDLLSHYSQKTFQFDEDLLSRVLSYIQAPNEYAEFKVNQKEYSDLFRIRHDLVLNQLAMILDFKLDSKISEYIDVKEPLLENLSPDIIKVTDKKVLLGELSVDHFPERAFKIKKAKYQYLLYWLEKMGYSVEYKVAIFSDSGDTYIDEIGFPGKCSEIIKLCSSLINLCKSKNPELEISRLQMDELDVSKLMTIEPEIETSPTITVDDVAFLNKIARLVKVNLMKQPFGGLDGKAFWSYATQLRSDYLKRTLNKEDHKAVLKFPFLFEEVIVRDTSKDEEVVNMERDIFKSDPYFNVVESLGDKFYKYKISAEDREKLAMEGPGASRYKDRSWYKVRRDRQKNFICNPEMDFSEMSSFLDSSHSYIKKYDDFEGFLTNNMMSRYLSVVESLAREISINSMRKERRKRGQLIITPTNIVGLYIMILPGPILRAGQKNSVVWYKLIWRNELKVGFQTLYYKTYSHGNLVCTRWLSVTAKKLDHYLRSRDQVLMAYFSYLSLSKESSFKDQIMKDNSNVLALSTAIWMEDSRGTSTILQDVRYFIMQKLSVSPTYSKLMRKIMIPIRSPIIYICLRNLFRFLNSDFKLIGKEDHMVSAEELEKKSKLIECERPVSSGPRIGFNQLINEMYFCMLFNKNEQEPTEDSFQILNKILEAEYDYERSREDGLVEYVGDDDDILSKIMKTDRPGSFSTKAIEIGSKLQLCSTHNSLGLGSVYKASNTKDLNKSLVEFATLKSSSVEGTENSRVKCIQAVIELLENGYNESFDIAYKFLNNDIQVQIFKKNQIGGVREISILDIKSRIKVNIVETYFRAMNREDDREMLTEGSRKFEVMRNNYKKTIGHFKFSINGDATRWAQSFYPRQFSYLISPHPTKIKGYAQHIFDQFTKKKIFVPKALSDQWKLKPDYYNGENKLMDSLKARYMSGEINIKNESNMCQGILHYTSSYLHICLMSFIEKIAGILFGKMGAEVYMESQVSSDDYLIIVHTTERDQRRRANVYRLMRNIIWQCQRLFNVHDSAKTSVSQIVYEFNSCFAMNFNYLSPIIKFAVASVECINTDSPSKMVSEGVNRVNQIIDNGGSIELASVAHRFNRKYIEDITNCRERMLPYELGVYPNEDKTTEVYMFGAEYHNFQLIHNFDNLTDREKKILSNNYRSFVSDKLELAANYLFSEDKQTTKIKLSIAPSSKWKSMIESCPYSKEMLEDILVNKPELLLSKNRDKTTQIVKVCLKLYTSNVREALRDTSPSIYYARYSAYKTAKSFYSGSEFKTYKECIEDMNSNEGYTKEILIKRVQNYNDMLAVHSLNKPSLSLLKPRPKNLSKRFLNLRMREKLGQLKTTILNLIAYKWFHEDLDSRDIGQYERDWRILKVTIPYLQDSYGGTISALATSLNVDATTSATILIRELTRQMSNKSFSHKTLAYGSNTNSIIDTYFTLQYNNQYESHYFSNDFELNDQEIKSKDILYDLASIGSLFDFFTRYSTHDNFKNFTENFGISNHSLVELLHVHYESLFYFFTDNYQRKKLLILLNSIGVLDPVKMIDFCSKSHILLRQWVLEQKFVDGKWIGPYSVKYSYMGTVLLITGDKKLEFSISKGKEWERSAGVCLKAFLTDFTIDFSDIKSEHGEYTLNYNPPMLLKTGSGIHLKDRSTLSLIPQKFKISVDGSRHLLSDNRGPIITAHMTMEPQVVNIRKVKEETFVYGIKMSDLIQNQFLLDTFNARNLVLLDRISLKGLSLDVKPNEQTERYLKFIGLNKQDSKVESSNVLELQLSAEDRDILDDSDDDGFDEEEIMAAESDDFDFDDDISFTDLAIMRDLLSYEVTYSSRQRLDDMPIVVFLKQNPQLEACSLDNIANTLLNRLESWQIEVCIYLMNTKFKSGMKISRSPFNIFNMLEQEVFFE